MNISRTLALCLPFCLALAAAAGLVAEPPSTVKSAWVYSGPDGKLVYKTTSRGDRIMDFSYAGYMGGGVAIPVAPVKKTVESSGEDDTARIQAAIDAVAAMPLQEGFRGAVLLRPGTFVCAGPIKIPASGIVLRGSGSGDATGARTTIKLVGKPHNGISAGVPKSKKKEDTQTPPSRGPRTTIVDGYVPSGAFRFHVADAKGFAPGDLIAIRKTVTAEWVKFMGMDDLFRDGKKQTWLSVGRVLTTERRIKAIAGNQVTLEVPLSDSFDAHYFKAAPFSVVKIEPKRISQVGIEHLHIECPLQAIPHTLPHFSAIRIDGEDCWVRDVICDETMDSVAVQGRRITIQRVAVNRLALHQGASRPGEFGPNATQTLIDRCTVSADNVWFSWTGSGVAGPVVLLNCTFRGNGRAEAHMRWSTGMLYDHCQALGGGLDMRNRGIMGSGHGWSMGWGVAWNCTAKFYTIQNPPGALNWMIGCTGDSHKAPRPSSVKGGANLPEGVTDSPGMEVMPQSLYLAQLAERLGPQALKNIGY